MPTNLGMVGIRSVFNAYLQAYSSDDLHASNNHRNEEETSFLLGVNQATHDYAIYNWKYGEFIRSGAATALLPQGTSGPTRDGRWQGWWVFEAANGRLEGRGWRSKQALTTKSHPLMWLGYWRLCRLRIRKLSASPVALLARSGC
jgi:hypothetical protein